MCCISDSNNLKSFSLIKFKFLQIVNCVSNSKEEPNAIPKKLFKSLSVFLPQPSAIFDGIETAHLLI